MKKPLLKFESKEVDKYNKPIYYVNNHKDEFLGTISRIRVGRFMHWAFCPDEGCYFTNGCLKEIVQFITKLYSKKDV